LLRTSSNRENCRDLTVAASLQGNFCSLTFPLMIFHLSWNAQRRRSSRYPERIHFAARELTRPLGACVSAHFAIVHFATRDRALFSFLLHLIAAHITFRRSRVPRKGVLREYDRGIRTKFLSFTNESFKQPESRQTGHFIALSLLAAFLNCRSSLSAAAAAAAAIN